MITQNYKDILLKYLTNNLNKNTGVNIPEFSTTEYDASTIYNQLSTAFPNGFVQNGVVQCKNSNGEYNGYTIAYGAYYTEQTRDYDLAKGYMLIINSNFELEKIITEYSSGTDCGIFMKLETIDDGTLIGLDYFDNKNRFIQLNNPSVKLPLQDYTLKLRYSLYLQNNVANMSHTLRGKRYVLDKDPNTANYLIGATDNQEGYEALTQLKVNVGAPNEWVDYTYQHKQSQTSIQFDVVYTYVYWQDEKPYISSYDLIREWDAQNSYWNIQLYVSTNNGTTTIANPVFQNINFSEEEWGEGSLSLISPTDYYLAFGSGIYNHDTDETDCKMRIIHHKNDSYSKLIYEYDFSQSSTTGLVGSYFDIYGYNLNGTICFIYSGIYERLIGRDMMFTEGLLITSEDDVATVPLGTPYYASYIQFHIDTIINQFDLYKFYVLQEDYDAGAWMLSHSNIIYNYLNYNGSEYENVNSLLPRQCRLYDENGIIFARNLYNKVINDNSTETTIQIPNTMLNDIEITQNKLIGATNYELIVNSDTIEKNIYETLYINYFNTINVENRNTQNYISNLNGAIRVNKSINNDLDYDNMKITKYRINYNDNTNEIKNVEKPTITNHIATYNINLYVGKLVNSVDLISDDENTVYQTINCSDLTLNKLYILKQDCYVE